MLNLNTPLITSSILVQMQPTRRNIPSIKNSTLSNSDRSFIEFTRCLHKAKSVVLELQAFSKTVKPTLSPYKSNPDEFTVYVNQHLEKSFRKFNHMCKILLVVLTKLESNQPVRRERIDSFRQEVILEWRKATTVRRDLLVLLQKKDQEIHALDTPTSNYGSDMIESDDDSDTTLEPHASSDSSS